MKIAVGMIVYNESYMLSLLLHRYARGFDGIVAIDTGSTDGSQAILESYGATVKSVPWVNFGDARNHVIKLAESLGYDYLMIMDADEALLVADVHYLKGLADGSTYAFPRLEFIESKDYINPIFYPDFQTRLFPLGRGYHFKGVIHEVLFQGNDTDNSFVLGKAIKIPFVHLFHYGKLKSPTEIHWKYTNYVRLVDGLPRLTEAPEGAPVSFSQGAKLKFHGPSPL